MNTPAANEHPETNKDLKKALIAWGIILILCIGLIGYLMITNFNLTYRLDELTLKVDTLEHPLTYVPLIFETGETGVASINSRMLGFRDQPEQPLYAQEYLPHNPIVTPGDELYAQVQGVDDTIAANINHFLKITQHRSLMLKPGYYYLRTNLGDFRIVVLDRQLPSLQKFFRLFYFYTSIAARGRCADYLSGKDALQVVFYSNNYSGNVCTGHVGLFQSLFRPYVADMRQIDFYGFLEEQGQEIPTGHSVLEFYIEGKWIVIDPMLGFIPFDAKGETPLSFLEFLQAKRQHAYQLKYLFRVPDLSFFYEDLILKDDEYRKLKEHYEYVANIPATGEFLNYFDTTDFTTLWSPTEVLVYILQGRIAFFMEKETYNSLTPEDWERYTRHYQDILKKHTPAELKALINLNMDDLYR